MSDVSALTTDDSPQDRRRRLEQMLREKAAKSRTFPPSFAQERLWLLDQLDYGNPVYNIPLAIRLSGELDVSVLRRVLDELVSRHESLRTRMCTTADGPMQFVEPHRSQELNIVDLQATSEREREQQALTLAIEESRKPFALEHGPLFRTMLLRLSPTEYIFVGVMHHIISDGWSLAILLREMTELYRAFLTEQSASLEELPIRYVDYASWQRQQLADTALDGQMEYWRQKLEGLETLELPTDFPRPAEGRQAGATVSTRLTAALVDGLNTVAREGQATFYMLMLTAVKALLHRYSGQHDVTVGSPIAGRMNPQTTGVVGLFVNTLVMRSEVTGETSFCDLLQHVRQTALDSFKHQEVPFEKLVETLNPERDTSRHPLFQVMLTVQSADWGDVELPGLSLSPITLDIGTSKFDLSFTTQADGDDLALSLEYDTDLFEPETAERMLQHLSNLLTAVVADPRQRVAEIDLMDSVERRRLLVEWNETQSDYPRHLLLHQLVEAQVARTPDSVAVVFEDHEMSYSELNRRANQLARRLRELGVQPDATVGIYADRSLEMLIAVLGVLKAGGAYVPLDPSFPADRLAFMIEDSGLEILLTQAALSDQLPAHKARVVLLDGDDVGATDDGPVTCSTGPDDLAYIIYTSGSTGKPKGVQIPHQAATNFLTSMQQEPGISADDTLLAVTTLSFDISVLELLLPLIAGGRVVIARREVASDGLQLVSALESSSATVMQATPATWWMLLEAGWRGDGRLKVLCGGEALPRDLADALLERAGSLWNMYGPTETTVWSTIQQIAPDDKRILAGRPIANTQVYILDEQLRPTLMGVAGELHIGGEGLARGYWQRPELTSERFVDNPFSDVPGARLYKTGDLARYRDDGKIDVLGRLDHQVKLRGFRIELGEIEAALNLHGDIATSVVIVREDRPGDRRLVAYLRLNNNQRQIEPSELREHLGEWVPSYMVPSAFVFLDEIPLTPNGKVNRRALPTPPSTVQDEATYVAPRSSLEQDIAEVWCEVLNLDRVGVHDNFFALGGHSLLATRMVARIGQQLQSDLPLRALFQSPTVAELAVRVAELSEEESSSTWKAIPLASRDGELLPSLTQESLWFLDQLDPDQATYSAYPTLRMKGALDSEILQRAIDEIVRRHESMRSRYPAVDGRPVMVIDPLESRPLNLIDLCHLSTSEREAALLDYVRQQTQQPIDLQNGPLIRATLLKLADDEHVLVAAAHHMVYDGWSLGLLTRELATIYAAFRDGLPSPLPELTIQYPDFAAWQREYLQGEELERLQNYWAKQLANLPPLDLPTDLPRPAIRSARGKTLDCKLSTELSSRVHEFCRREGITPFMALLSAFQAVLARYSGQDDIAVGSPVANRNRPEIEPMIGYFINMVVLRGDFAGDPTFRDIIGRVRQTALDAYEHQELTLDRVVDVVNPVRDTSRHPLFQVMFVLQNQEAPSLSEMGLEVEEIEHGLVEQSSYFELSLSLEETPEGFRGGWNFNTDLFHEETAQRMIRHFGVFLSEAIADPDRPLSAVRLADDDDEQLLLREWNDTQVDYSRDRFIHELFESHAAKTPDVTAVVDGSSRWTYHELNRRANQLAHRLQRDGVGPEVRVGICLERSPELLMAVMGVLKAGGAYVPLDPGVLQGAEARAQFVLDDAQVALLLTDSTLATSIDFGECAQILLDGESGESLSAESVKSPNATVSADNLAYVLYTSGSTGRPKGVMVTHGNLLNAYIGWDREYGLSGDIRVHLQMASFGFDVFAGDMMRALCSGGTLVLCRKEILLDPVELLGLIQRERVDAAEFVPVVLRTLIEHLEETGQRLETMGLVVVGSDAWYVADHKRALRVLDSNTRLINSYGLTETTIDSCWFEGEIEATTSGLIPIGRPFPNVTMYVLDAALQPTPIGVPGELYIGGEGVARGYIDEQLNSERYIADPFAADQSASLCRTGDRARWRSDAQLEFLGRADDQVKIRGFRIEPGEVDQVLREHPALAEAAVAVRERELGDPRLVAYTVPKEAESPTFSELRQFLRQRLPEYMIPTLFETLTSLPISSNGKVDRRALPDPDWSAVQRENEFVAPRTAIECEMASIWSELLNVEEVGARDSFFDLGGNSLLALRMASRVRDAFSVELPLVTLFTYPILEELADQVTALQSEGHLPELPAITPAPRDEPLPLSYGQEALWTISRIQEGPTPYAMFPAARVNGPLDLGAFERAVNAVMQRHETLRTTFTAVDDEPVQVIAPFAPQPLTVVDLSDLATDEREAEARRYQLSQSQRPIDLEEGPLARVEVLRLAENEHILLVGMHHIIYDGLSMDVLSHDLLTAYRAIAAGHESPLRELPIQYADYARWQRERLQGEVLQELNDYWLSHLADLPTLEIPTDRMRPAVRTTDGALCSRQLPSRLSRSIRDLGRDEGATPFMTLLAAVQTLLARYSGQDDFPVGTPVAGRLRPETEDLIGYFVNTLVLRADLADDPSFRDLLGKVRETTLNAFDHQELPFERLVQELNPPRDRSRHPLIQVMFVFNRATETSLEQDGFQLNGLDSERQQLAAEFDLTLTVIERQGEFELSIRYRTDLFDKSTIERLLSQFQVLLESIAADADRSVSQLTLLPQSEREQLLVEWNDSDQEYAREKCLHELFEEQVERTPATVAVVDGDRRLTYRELNQQANSLAARLLSLDVRDEQLVGLLADQSIEMIIGLIAILKTGGAYVPIATDTPAARMRMLAEDTGMKLLVAGSMPAESMTSEIECLIIDEGPAEPEEAAHANPSLEVAPRNLAYVLYTSGSTGTPKGVMVEHRQLVNYAFAVVKQYGMAETAACMMLQPLTVDSSQTMIFPVLGWGGTIHLIPRELSLESERLDEYCRTHPIDFLKIAPSHLSALLEDDRHTALLPRRGLIVGGESMPRSLVERLKTLEFAGRLWNHYGPTETTVGVLTEPVDFENVDLLTTLPVGKPLANVRSYVLDIQGSPVPIGVPGELYLGGDAVARGYLNRPELTSQAFVPDPFSGGESSRLYRTGDVVRWLDSGSLEFLGRNDEQIKLRGFRIEPGEIRRALIEHESVSDALVRLVKAEGREPQLVAYWIPSDRAAIESELLRDHMRRLLPSHMVPATFLKLESFPMSVHGKISLKALPLPEHDLGSDRESIAPRNADEEAIAALWCNALEVDRVGVTDNFFALGGHSLLAIRIVSRINREFDVHVAVRELFEAPTIEGLAERLQLARESGSPSQLPPITSAPRDKPLRLSYGQEALWTISRIQEGPSPYAMFPAARVNGPLDVDAFERAVNEVVRRHETLRTTFSAVGDDPVQVIAPYAAQPLKVVDLSELSADEREEEAKRYQLAESQKPIDLEKGPLARVEVVRLSGDEHILLVGMHHIIYDGLSMDVLSRELLTAYRAFAAGVESPPPELPIQYADYALWQRERLQGEVLTGLREYWIETLDDLPALELPTDHTRPPQRTTHGARCTRELSSELSRAIRDLGRETGSTPFMTLLAAYQTLLSRYSGQADFPIGTPVAGRLRPETEDLIGFFVNTLVLRADLSDDPSFQDLLGRVRQTTLDAFEHQEMPFERLVQELNPPRDPSRHPIFQVMFVLNRATETSVEQDGFQLTGLNAEQQVLGSEFDLQLTVTQRPDDFELSLSYRTDLFEEPTIERMLEQFEVLLREITIDVQRSVSQLCLSPEVERQRLLVEWNNTARDYETDACLHELVEAQAVRTPDAVAVEYDGAQLTYRELNTRANQWARMLVKQGAAADVPVGVCLERSTEMVVSLLAILKAGSAYMPLDPDYPVERLQKMLGDSRPPVVLTTRRLEDRVAGSDALLVFVEDVDADVAGESKENLDVGASQVDIAYVIYTSGSTGVPKGVRNSHRGICNRLLWMQEEYRLTAEDRVLQKTPYSFDVSVWEFFWPLMTGARLVVARPGGHQDPQYLVDVIVEREITTLHFVPSMLHIFLSEGDVSRCRSIKRVICSGEALPYEVQQLFFAKLNTQLHNLYGPTEAAVDVTYWECRPNERELVPIGKPIANIECYILDQNREPTPLGVPGELYLGGIGLARDYLNRPELTAEKFVPHPFSTEPDARLYRTGDLCRFLSDGNILFLGRLDDQVKIRGNRIELGEIQAALLQHAGVQSAAVTSFDDGAAGKELAAYWVPGSEGTTVDDLRSFLRESLPEYMVPSVIMEVDSIPLSPNGKANVRLLPSPVRERSAEQELIAPRNPDEEAIAALWCDVLRLERLGVTDNFFALGGHSLLAVQIMSRINREFDVQIAMRELFEAPTVEGLAERLQLARQDGGGEDLPPITPVKHDGLVPASFGQEELWVIGNLQQGPTAYAMGTATRINGTLDERSVERAINEVVRRHESLRTTFRDVDGQLFQVIAPFAEQSYLELIDLTGLPPDEQERETQRHADDYVQRPFDLATGPLLRVGLVKLDDEQHVVLLAMHHIIYDGWSMDVLSREILSAYLAFSMELPSPLEEMPIQFGDYSIWQRQRLQGAVLERLRSYWLEQLKDIPELELPTDRPRPQVLKTAGAHSEHSLPGELSQAIQQLSNEERATTFMTFMAAYQCWLMHFSGQQDFALGIPVAGRLRPETEGLVGYFMNDIVLRADLSGEPTFRQLLTRIRERVLEAFEHQEMPFIQLMRDLNPPRRADRHPLIQTEIVFQNTPSTADELPGVELSELGGDDDATGAALDLSLFVKENDERFDLLLSYRTDLFEEQGAQRILKQLQVVLEAATEDPDQLISQLTTKTLPSRPAKTSCDQKPARAEGLSKPYETPRSGVEQQIAEIWARTLEVEGIGRHDDFFALGGHSLLVVRVMLETSAALYVELPNVTLFEAPTVAGIAERYIAAGAECRFDEIATAKRNGASPSNGTPDVVFAAANGTTLVPLRTGGGATPLFCIHGLGGHVTAFAPLAQSLGEGRPVYALQGHGLFDGQDPHHCIEAMAACYVNEIQRVQPHGPYLLAGWSLGGMIALEMAQRLRAASEEVELVALLDSSPTIPVELSRGLDDQPAMKWIASQLKLPESELGGLPLQQQWDWIAECANRTKGDHLSEVRRLARACQAHLMAGAEHTVGCYAGRTVLFVADGGASDLAAEWNSLCTQLEVSNTPGSHYTMLQSPHVGRLARQLDTIIAAAANSDETVIDS